jgi:hypothetical protein
MSPLTVLMPTPRSRKDYQLLEQIAANNAPLALNDKHCLFDQRVMFRRMFRKPDDNDLMIDPSQIDRDQIAKLLPLFEGENCGQYQFFDRTKKANESSDKGITHLLKIPVQTEYLVSEDSFAAKIKSIGSDLFHTQSALLGIRRITSSTNERTSIATILPFTPASASLILALGIDSSEMALLQAVLNSLVFDYTLRMYLSQPSLPQIVLEQIPVPMRANAIQYLGKITTLSASLSASNGYVDEWAKEVGVTEPLGNDISSCRALIDVYVAKSYGLCLEDFLYILSPESQMGPGYPSETFRQFEAEQIKKHGFFQYRDLIISAWHDT